MEERLINILRADFDWGKESLSSFKAASVIMLFPIDSGVLQRSWITAMCQLAS